MKKYLLLLWGLLAAMGVNAKEQATLATDPSPVCTSAPFTITIKLTSSSYSGNVYLYSWVESGNNYTAASWNDTNTDEYKMTKISDKEFSFTVENAVSFYHISEENIKAATAIGFIAKNGNNQTEDLKITDFIYAKYSGGQGTASAPYLMSKPEDIVKLSTETADWREGVYISLTKDLDISTLKTPIGNNTTPFCANFNGGGHSLKKLKLRGTTVSEGTGLFGCVADGAVISNLGVIDATVSGVTYTGILAGEVKGGRIEKCFTTGTVTGSSICAGGLVGLNNGEIVNSFSTADVSNPDDYATGGLVGKNTGTINRTIASGDITGHDYVGGLVGANYGTVNSSFAVNAKISSENNYVARFGGNNNVENLSNAANHSWEYIPTGHTTWTDHGDHALVQHPLTLTNQQKFAELSGWDFNNDWSWNTGFLRKGPQLQNVSNQPLIYPQALYDTISAVEEIAAESDTQTVVAYNRGDELITVSATEGLSVINVYAVSGMRVATVEAHGALDAEISLSGALTGVYMVQAILMSGKTSVEKIVK